MDAMSQSKAKPATQHGHTPASELISIQNSKKVIMSNGEEMEITTPCHWAGVVTGRGSGKSL